MWVYTIGGYKVEGNAPWQTVGWMHLGGVRLLIRAFAPGRAVPASPTCQPMNFEEHLTFFTPRVPPHTVLQYVL
jgi:hypothetical protein